MPAIDSTYDCRWNVWSGDGGEENGWIWVGAYFEYGNQKEERALIVDFDYQTDLCREDQVLDWVSWKVLEGILEFIS